MRFEKAPIRRHGRPGRMLSPAKRAAMLEAARVEFGLNGYRDTTMDAIALRAQVSKRTLYNHFSAKEDVFRAVVSEWIAVISRSVGLRYTLQKSLREQLEAYARASIALVRDADNLKLFRAIMAEHIRDPSLVQPAFGTGNWESEYGFEQWIEAAQLNGELTTRDPRRAAHIFSSLMRGLIIWPVLLGRTQFASEQLPPEVCEAIEMFLNHFARPQRHRART